MKRLNVFATQEEIESIKTELSVSGMYLSGGTPMGDPQKKTHKIALNHGLPEITGYYGIDLKTGEFLQT